MQKVWLTIILLFLISLSWAQSPYHLQPKKELAYFGTGLGTAGLGFVARSQTNVFTEDNLNLLLPNAIWEFDRNATTRYSLSAQSASDVLWYSSHAMPLLFLAGEKTRQDFGKISTLYGETILITSGLTLLTKYSVRRARPYSYNQDAPLAKRLSLDAKGSFFSGHTSLTAANTFFVAKVFSDYYPDSKWKPVVWVTAATVPAVTGYLRIQAGRHFPTDVIVGYVVGAAVGYFTPHLHKINKKKTEKFMVIPN